MKPTVVPLAPPTHVPPARPQATQDRPRRHGSLRNSPVGLYIGGRICCGFSLRVVIPLIYIFNYFYYSHFYGKYKFDPQLVFMEIFNIDMFYKVLISGVQYGCIAMALFGAIAKCPRLFVLPIIYQIVLGSVQVIVSSLFISFILFDRHDWFEILMEKEALQPFPLMDLNWGNEAEEVYLSVTILLCAVLNILLAHFLRSLQEDMQSTPIDPNDIRPFLLLAYCIRTRHEVVETGPVNPNAAHSASPSHDHSVRSLNAQASSPDRDLRRTQAGLYIGGRLYCGLPLKGVTAAICVVNYIYLSYFYAKYNFDPQLVYMEMFNIYMFYKLMIMGVQFGCIALALFGALDRCSRLLDVPIIFQSLLGSVQITFAIYALICVLIGRHGWHTLLKEKEALQPFIFIGLGWDNVTEELFVVSAILLYAFLNILLAHMLVSLQDNMVSLPVGFNARRRVDASV